MAYTKTKVKLFERSTWYQSKVGLHSFKTFEGKSFYCKRLDNWYFADPVSIAQQQRLSSLIEAEPGPSRAVAANFPSSHSQLSQAASPQARPVNFPWIDNSAMLRSPSSLQTSMPFQQSSSKQLASKGTRFTEEETKLLLVIWEEEFNGFTDKKELRQRTGRT